jgi:hypothetical protein
MNETDKALLDLLEQFAGSQSWWEPGDFSLRGFYFWLKEGKQNGRGSPNWKKEHPEEEIREA